jgi:BMFP domain-containing protein YqiC
VEALRDLAELADPTPRYVPEPTGSRRRKLLDQMRAKVTSGLAPAVRAVRGPQARFNEQLVAVLLDVVRRLQASGDDGALRARVEQLERRLAALEGSGPAAKAKTKRKKRP